jgi:hypothetical protein
MRIAAGAAGIYRRFAMKQPALPSNRTHRTHGEWAHESAPCCPEEGT